MADETQSTSNLTPAELAIATAIAFVPPPPIEYAPGTAEQIEEYDRQQAEAHEKARLAAKQVTDRRKYMTPEQREKEDRAIQQRHRDKLEAAKQERANELATKRAEELNKELATEKPRLMRTWLIDHPGSTERQFNATIWPLLRDNLAEELAAKKHADYVARYTQQNPIDL